MCGCGKTVGSGSCSDCKKIKGKSVASKACEGQYTGDLLYDGDALSCSDNADLVIAVNDNPNDIIKMFYEHLCILSQPTLYATSNTSESFSGSMVPISDCDITIPAGKTGKYDIVAVLNYIQNAAFCKGEVTLLKNGTAIVDTGLKKVIQSYVNAGTDYQAGTVTLLYSGTFTAADVIQIGIKGTSGTDYYLSLGGQITATRKLK